MRRMKVTEDDIALMKALEDWKKSLPSDYKFSYTDYFSNRNYFTPKETEIIDGLHNSKDYKEMCSEEKEKANKRLWRILLLLKEENNLEQRG